MTLAALTTVKVEAPLEDRKKLLRIVGDGDLITVTEGGEVLGVFQVKWVACGGRMVAMLNQPGSAVTTMIGPEGAEVVEGLRITIPRPRDGHSRPTKRALLFLADAAITVRHARGEAHG
jgi:hypothetical protein